MKEIKAKEFLLSTFGNANLKGFGFICYILDNYTDLSLRDVMDIYDDLDTEFSMTKGAVERVIRYYKNDLIVEYGYDNLLKLLNYKTSNQRISNKAFLICLEVAFEKYKAEANTVVDKDKSATE